MLKTPDIFNNLKPSLFWVLEQDGFQYCVVHSDTGYNSLVLNNLGIVEGIHGAVLYKPHFSDEFEGTKEFKVGDIIAKNSLHLIIKESSDDIWKFAAIDYKGDVIFLTKDLKSSNDFTSGKKIGELKVFSH